MTQQEWEQKRDELRAQFPIGTRVETVPDCFGLECEDGIEFVENHDGGGAVRGVVVDHSASRVLFRDDDGSEWTMVPASLRVVDFRCAVGCGYPVANHGEVCGECACEDDGGIW
jgi:hypothetical protein